MKRLLVILSIVSILLFSCAEKQPEPVVAEPEPLPFTISDTLLQIDTLLQSRPDSALLLLIDPLSFRAQRGISHTFNENYRNLLLSEALYKNGNLQYYRDDLQTSMCYFDSLAMQYPGNDDATFYSARSHYMNGVGYYETDSVVAACREYLHTLEIMENHYDVDKLTGYKAKFMGLTYGRLGELFSSQFLMDMSIDCYKKSLYFIKKDASSGFSSSNIEHKIGAQFHEKGLMDSASYYYNQALKHIPDTNNVLYRDIIIGKTLILHLTNCDSDTVISFLTNIMKRSDGQNEKLSRMLTIGGVLYEKNMYDSAFVYLVQVFQHSNNSLEKLLAAQYLQKICITKNDEVSAKAYTDYLASCTIQEYDNKVQISQIGDLYKNYLISHEKSKADTDKIYKTLASYAFLVFVIVITLAYLTKKSHDKKHQKLLIDINSIKDENDNLRTERDMWLFTPVKTDSDQYRRFIEEPVCSEILKIAKTSHVTSRDKYFEHKSIVIDDEMYDKLEAAVTKHYGSFKNHLIIKGIKKKNDHRLCYLYMLGLEDNQIAILKGRDYSTIKKQAARLQNKLETDKKLADYIISAI